MSFYVYIIHNILNNKVYIGKAKNLQKRWAKHIEVASCKRIVEKFFIHKAIAKYGVENFTFSMLQSFDNENDCFIAEIYWIKYFQSKIKNYGYNLTDGGEGCSGRIVSEKTRQKMRDKATGRKHTPETKEKLRAINIGKMPSNIEQLKIMNIGKTLSNHHKQKISEARKGIVFTEQHKHNISKALTGLFIGDKGHFFGKKHTEEVKEMSRGENNKQSKLTSNQIIEIRNKYSSKKYTYQQLADAYGVSREQIGRIVRHVDWKNLGESNV
jgi:group I intron endonuclease